MTDHKTVRDFLERAKEDAEVMRRRPLSKWDSAFWQAFDAMEAAA